MNGSLLLAIAVLQLSPCSLLAQGAMTGMLDTSATPRTWTLGAQAIAVGTIQSPAHADRTYREGYFSQPMVMGTASIRNNVELYGMLDFEGITLERGELDAGIYGEGYVDRRHPHTYLHELVASAGGTARAVGYSVAVGKGFVPFGTDDPMVRPFEKYPVNHHISQIVERLLASFAVSSGPVTVEAARFNGDEPESPSDLPNSGRLWDSWAGRVTLTRASGIELQSSVARVKSPELPEGGGLDQRKVNLSLRFESIPAARIDSGGVGSVMLMGGASASQKPDTVEDVWHQYLLIEWGRSADYAGSTQAFAFTTTLAEAEFSHSGVAFAVRWERTERPEEERLANPFRTPRPANDFSIIGRTRWNIASARLTGGIYHWSIGSVSPFIEVAHQQASALARAQVFDPAGFYGSSRMWGTSAGLTITAGMIHHRTGQYGYSARHQSGPTMSMDGTASRRGVFDKP
jgi:hypothetical protein